jgi:protease-4
MLKKMTDKERDILKQLVDEMFDRFKGIVKGGRPNLTEEKLTEVATGQIFTTKQAMAHGLVDQEGFIEDAILRAAELANLAKDKYKTVKYKSQPSLMAILSGDVRAQTQAPAEPFALPLAALREAASPRPYYIYSALPSLSVFDLSGVR